MLKPRDELRAEWIATLRSGKYKQARGMLCKPGVGYCCLGVLCQIAGILDGGTARIEDESSCGTLPPILRKHIGISLSDQRGLVVKNDTHRASFGEIADLLETGEYWDE